MLVPLKSCELAQASLLQRPLLLLACREKGSANPWSGPHTGGEAVGPSLSVTPPSTPRPGLAPLTLTSCGLSLTHPASTRHPGWLRGFGQQPGEGEKSWELGPPRQEMRAGQEEKRRCLCSRLRLACTRELKDLKAFIFSGISSQNIEIKSPSQAQ